MGRVRGASESVEGHADDLQPARETVEGEGAQLLGRCAQGGGVGSRRRRQGLCHGGQQLA